jgi:gliding motility-associated-like protein
VFCNRKRNSQALLRKEKLIVFVTFLCAYFGWSQANVPPSLDATGDQYYCPLSQINVVTSFTIVDPDDTEIEALHVQISEGYVNGQDILTLTGIHPNIEASWDAQEGKLSMTGLGGTQATYVDLIAAVQDVVFSSSSVNVSGERRFSFTVGDANYLPSTDHYYEYVPMQGVTWTNARDLAASYTYFGLQGYLATITSQEEAVLSGEQAAGAGWIGGSDAGQEGVWRWMTGPEAGTIFWNGGINGSTPPGGYANWNTNEPNNCCGGEDYAHVTAPNIGTPGSWNDLSNTGEPDPANDYHPQGFIVEYGGTPGDPVVDISASTRITVPEIINTVSAENCGPGNVNLEATASVGDVVWFNAATGGTPIFTGTNFTTPLINTTTTYYALASVNGCLEGDRTAVVATIKPIPNIDAVNDDLICENASGTVSATTSQGTISWYDAITGGNLLGSGNSYTSPVLLATTTYYAEVALNGCVNPVRTPATVTVQITPAPIGNILQTFCDLENATIGDLVVVGTDVIWYDSVTSTTPLNANDLLANGTYYATQTINTCESVARLAVDVIIYETVSVLNPSTIPTLEVCDTTIDGDDTNGFTPFDLTQNENVILNGADPTNFNVLYFTDTFYTNEILTPVAFVNTVQNGQTIYVRVENILDNSCYTDTSFEVKVNALPVIQNTLVFRNCDEDGVPDGFTDFNLTEVNDIITNGNAVNFNFTYHLSFNDAETNINAVNPIPFNNVNGNNIYVRVENAEACFRVSTIDLQVSTTSFQNGYLETLAFCDDDGIPDGFREFDLLQVSQQFLNQFPTGQNLTVHYYRNLQDAQLEQNEILDQTNYTNETAFSQTLYVRVESSDNGDCFGIGPHLQLTVYPRPQFEVDQSAIFCLNGSPITLETFNPQGNYTYVWTNAMGDVISLNDTAVITEAGAYTVVATSVNNCVSFPYVFNVVASGIATITDDDITVKDFSNNNTITIDTTNLGIGDYEFSLDNEFGPYQDDSFFDYVGAGAHVLYVRDKMGCGIASIDVFVLGFPKFFTPNSDGYNDTWNIKGWNDDFSTSSSIQIFDRYGKLIKHLYPGSEGWTGTINGYNLPSSDYWFVANLVNVDGTSKVLKGHFSLVR